MLAHGQQPVVKSNPKPVYMHYMPWFDTPESDGYWGWHWTMNNRNPNNYIDVQTERRDIASHYYPLIGPYSSSDTCVIEYHLLLMKLSGIDGVLIDWYGENGSNPDVGNLLRNSNAFIQEISKYGLQYSLVIEDRFSESVYDMTQNIKYAKENYFNTPEFIRYGNNQQPLLGVFGPVKYQTEGNWNSILSAAGEGVEFLQLWGESSDVGANSSGEYVWIWEDETLDNYYSHMESYYQYQAVNHQTTMGVIYPGFNDFYTAGGVHESYFNIPHNNGSTLDGIIGLVNQYSNEIDIVQLATWNDYGEGTVFEPTRETGYTYLSKIQNYTGVNYSTTDLEQVNRLYELRKKHQGDMDTQNELNKVRDYFVNLEIEKAIQLMDWIEFGTTGTNEKQELSFSIFPNPTTDLFVIEGLSGIQSVIVFSARGEVVKTSKHPMVNISELPAGVYSLKITTDSGVENGIIIKK